MKSQTMRTGGNPADTEILATPDVRRAVAGAVLYLEENLLSTAQMLGLCRQMTTEPSQQGLDAMKTAAHLLKAQSEAAAMLARVARGVSRHRTIVEHDGVDHAGVKPAGDSPTDTAKGRLNSKKFSPPPAARAQAERPGKRPRQRQGP